MNRLPGIDHIYIIHLPTAVTRKQYLDTWIVENNFAPGYVEYCHAFEAESLPKELLRRSYLVSPAEHARRAAYTSGPDGTPPEFPISTKNIAVCLEHHAIYLDTVKKGYNQVLIFEDDVVFEESFAEEFAKAMTTFPTDAEFASISDGFDMHISKPPYNIATNSFTQWYKNPMHHTRCVDSYILTKEAAQKLAKNFLPFTLPIDWELNYWLKENNVQVYWLEPTIVRQGTWTGAYQSIVKN